MPAFMFEKIAPPVHHGVQLSASKEPRGVIVQMIDRLAEKRLHRQPKVPRKATDGLSLKPT